VFANGPTLVAPVLGTPASGNLANCTGYPTSGLTGVLPVANGGTGASTAPLALNNLLPSQSGNNRKFLTTDGASTVTWGDGVVNVLNISALRALSPVSGETVNVRGYYTEGDGGGGVFYGATGGSYTDNGGTIITQNGSSSTSAWLRPNSSSINVKTFGAKGDGTTDDTLAVQNAILSLPWQRHANPVQSGYVNGGGTIYFPDGIYLITDTLLFSGSTRFTADEGLSAYIKFRPSSSKTLFKGNTSRYSRTPANFWDFVTFEHIMFGGDLFSTGNSDICLDMTNVSRFRITRCYFEQFTTALYKAGTQGYYHLIDQCEFYDNHTHIYDNGAQNPVVVLGGVFWNFELDFSGAGKPYPDYLIYTKGVMNFHGTALEPRTAIFDEDTFACVYCDLGGTASFYGCYSESFYPLVSVDMDYAQNGQVHIDMNYPYAFPLIRTRNFLSSTADGPLPFRTRNRPPIDMAMDPIRTNLINNCNMQKGNYNYGLGSGVGYTTVFDTSTKLFNNLGVITTTFTAPAASPLVDLVSKTIQVSDIGPYDKSVVNFAALIKTTNSGASSNTTLRFQVQQLVDGTLAYFYAIGPVIDYGNGWKLYTVSLKLFANIAPTIAGNVSVIVKGNVATGTTGTIQVAGIFSYTGGWEPFPYPQNEEYSGASPPITGTWSVSDVFSNSAPVPGGTPGWVCTTAGSPGTWKAMANLAP
jgi:hypothetical protein